MDSKYASQEDLQKQKDSRGTDDNVQLSSQLTSLLSLLEKQIDDLMSRVEKTQKLYEQFLNDFPEVYIKETAA